MALYPINQMDQNSGVYTDENGNVVLAKRGTVVLDTSVVVATAGQVVSGDGTRAKSLPVSGDLSLAYSASPNPALVASVTDLSLTSEARGDLARRGATSWERVAAATSGQMVVGDGTDVISAPLTGDGALATTGGNAVFAAKHATVYTLRVPSSSGIDTDGLKGALAGCDQILDVTKTEAAAAHAKVWDNSAPTNTEQAVTSCKVYDLSATAYANIEDTATGDFVQWALLPSNTTDGDAVYFSAAETFGELYFDLSATNQTYTADALIWEYWDGEAWATLTLAGDTTHATVHTGARSFNQDGYVSFSAPVGWTSTTVDGTAGYFVRARVVTAANISQIGLLDAHRHYTTVRGLFADIETASAGDFVQWALLPSNTEDTDALYLGNASQYPQLYFDMSGTVQTYTGDALVWEYWDGSSWSTLTLAHDYTDATAQDGKRSFGRDGSIVFVAPSDWVTSTVDAVEAYWIRARPTAANISQVGILNAHRQYSCTPAVGFVAPHACTITGVTLRDEAGTAHSTAAVKFQVVDFTSWARTAELSFAQSKRHSAWGSLSLAVAAGDVLGVVITQEDGNAEIGPASFELAVTLV